MAHGKSAKSWKTNARSGPGPAIGRPATRTSPAVGRTRPPMILSSVVFPQPLGPSRLLSWPGGIRRSTPRSASTPVS